MLRLRICPNCQEETYSKEAYFCHRCGAELSPSPDLRSEPEEKLPIPSQPKKGKSRKLVVVVAAALCAALLSAIGAGVYYFYSKSQAPSFLETSTPKNEIFLADLSFEVQNHPFSAKGLSEIVPAEVDLYLESVDPEIMLPSLVSAEDWSEGQKFFNEQVGLSPVEAASFLEEEFAVVQESTASAFLARVRDTDFVEQKIAEVEEYEDWQAKMVNGFLVVSNSSELIRKIEEAQKKLTLNLSLTSGFVEARRGLPKTGQIFYYGKKRLGFMPEEVKGEAFVISKKEEGILIVGL